MSIIINEILQIEMKNCKGLLPKRSIEVEVQEPTFDNKSNFQSWARKVRYDFFFELATKNDTDQIYVAHHLDDHLETYLFKK